MALGTSRIRQRKLNTRATLPILREDQLDDTHDDQNNVPRIETGVEKGEEVVGLPIPVFSSSIFFLFPHPKACCYIVRYVLIMWSARLFLPQLFFINDRAELVQKW